MIGEVQANLSFADLKLGQKIQVDIHDPKVAALVQAGYLKVLWRKHVDVGACGEFGDCAAADLDPGDPGYEAAPQGEVDGDSPDQSDAEGPIRP